MAGTVELGADLADLGYHQLVVAYQLPWTVWDRAAGGQAENGQLPTPRAKHRHVGLIDLA